MMNTTTVSYSKFNIIVDLDADYILDEATAVTQLLNIWDQPAQFFKQVQASAKFYIDQARQLSGVNKGLQAFLIEYDLSSKEGVVLLCLAEALLRIPDSETANIFIQDQLSRADWRTHLHHSESLFVNAGTWGLILTGVLMQESHDAELGSLTTELMKRVTKPIFRTALREAMRLLGGQFILGASLAKALVNSRQEKMSECLFSYDMLGEEALCDTDADRYFILYQDAIAMLGKQHIGKPWKQRDAISIKLSALHPRFEILQRGRVMQELIPKLRSLVLSAKQAGIGVTIDAEEANRLSLSIEVYQNLLLSLQNDPWDGLGIVIQAYQKRAINLIEKLQHLSKLTGKKIPVRLVKGAYWDAEIKSAQEMGLAGFPVFTRKCYTDVSYLICAEKLLQSKKYFYPQFATHNPLSLSAVLLLCEQYQCHDFEIQRLHGMGKSLHDSVLKENRNLRCRIYAPVGGHKELLPYLVRRLLENGANTSFVNQVNDSQVAIKSLLNDPFLESKKHAGKSHPKIKLARALFLPNRINSNGVNIHSNIESQSLIQAMEAFRNMQWQARPMVQSYDEKSPQTITVESIGCRKRVIGNYIVSDMSAMDQAMINAQRSNMTWESTPVHDRAANLIRLANLIEKNRAEFCYLLCHEAGKTLVDALAEIREAVDFCRYYAEQAMNNFSHPITLSGPTGESNHLHWHARGIFVCISPWNFPLAIMVGQISAALVMGNTVIAKPASSTVLIAHRFIMLCYAAGIPKTVLSFLPSNAELFMSQLLVKEDIAGVAFTGSTQSATSINRCLAQREGAIVHLIAETGGINTMIVDSSALVEQVALDVVGSAFNSAGQRCSALRVLYIQDDIANRLIELIVGVIENLCHDESSLLATDIGPLINLHAVNKVNQHIQNMRDHANVIYQQPLSDIDNAEGYVGPTVIEIDELGQLTEEVFGPVLHVIRYSANKIDTVLEQINQSHYGLTLGIHSRIESSVKYIMSNVRVGNIYVNRNMIGAVVGVQPFGGEGLSGTGPKAGGPNYLYAFTVERLVTKNTTAIGGNATLLTMRNND